MWRCWPLKSVRWHKEQQIARCGLSSGWPGWGWKCGLVRTLRSVKALGPDHGGNLEGRVDKMGESGGRRAVGRLADFPGEGSGSRAWL